MKQIIGIMVLLVFTNVVCAEMAPGETWNKTFGGNKLDDAYYVQQTSDGGYILAGMTHSYGAGENDFWLVKTDSSGNEQWNKTFGGSDSDSARSAHQTSDGGYILAGTTHSYGYDDGIGGDFWLVKTDPEGNKEWDKTFGGSGVDGAGPVQQTSDGGYILAGCTVNGEHDFWLVKTDSDGNKEWDKTFGGSSGDFVYSVQQTFDGGYILAGATYSYGAGECDFWLVKTDSDGNEEWDKTFGGGEVDGAHSVQQTSDGGYILAGYTYSYGAGSGDFWLVKTDSDGNKEWDKIFGGSEVDIAQSVQQTSDGGYILAGTAHSYSDFWLIKIGGTDPTPPAKATPTAIKGVTPTTTIEATPTHTSTPGFAVGSAITWLLAVTYLVLRQRRE